MIFTTADVPEREQFSFFRDAFSDAVLGIRSEPLAPTGRGLRAEAEAWIAPSLQYFSFSSENYAVSRGRREIARQPWDSFWIYHEHGSGAQFELGGREFLTAAGDLIIGDADQDFAHTARQEYRHGVWLLPKALVSPHLPASGRLLSLHLRAGQGLAAVLAAYLGSLKQEIRALEPSQVEAVADNLSRLAAVVCGASAADHQEAARAGRLAEARRYIERHLAEPDLSAARAAAALRMSERALYALFETSGTSFAAYVRCRRLEECRAALLANPSRPVIDVAFAWGFGSMPSFYRAFQAAYGLAPGDLREAARRDPAFAANAGNEMRCGRRRDAQSRRAG